MKTDTKHSEKAYLYSGSLAEFVSNPSDLTFNYFQNWFTGQKSVGLAMKLVGLPFKPSKISLLQLHDREVLMDLKAEELTLYKNTVFQYRMPENVNEVPQLELRWQKCLNPANWPATFRIIWAQGKWIGQPDSTVTFAKTLVDEIPSKKAILTEKTQQNRRQIIEETLETQVVPVVLAIGLLAEFYQQLLVRSSQAAEIQKYCDNKISKNDWFFKSISEQYLVKSGALQLSDFIKLYGLRADTDYELTCPRWYEIPDVIQQRIAQSQPLASAAESLAEKSDKLPTDLQKSADTFCELQLLRSEAKRKMLVWMDVLRTELVHTKVIEQFSKPRNSETKIRSTTEKANQGKGIAVSPGITAGKALHITTNEQEIPDNTIGIFTNASPQFSTQFPKCSGLIFLKGGQTSHGAIVAREFKIPAIISASAVTLGNGQAVELNGTTGEWHSI
jgi:phosphohistidine swiveling domain-containing protein